MNPVAHEYQLASRIGLTAELEVEDEWPAPKGNSVLRLTVGEVRHEPPEDGATSLVLGTNEGGVRLRYHLPAARGTETKRAVLWVGGSGGGVDGPAGRLYAEASTRLTDRGLASLRLDYRRPNDLPACVLDALLGISFLQSEGIERIAVVGHSFGGAVAISAGAISGAVTAVVALSTQTYGTELVAEVSPRPLLLLHGAADEILPPECSELVYAAAREPKELKLVAGARHGLDSARAEVLAELLAWLERNT